MHHNLINKATSQPVYTTYATYASGYTHPTGMAIDSNLNIYFADGTGSGNVGRKLVTTVTPPTKSNYLTGVPCFSVAIDSTNNVYTTSFLTTGGGVCKNSSSALVITLNRTYSIAIDPSNNIFIGTSQGFLYYYLSTNYSRYSIFPAGGGGSIPSLSINNGKLYVSRTGIILTMNLTDIYAMPADPSTIATLTFAGSGPVATNGAITGNVLATNVTLNNPYGVAFDNYGNAYIADWQAGSIKKVNSAGYISNFFDSYASLSTMRPSAAFNPVGICCDKNNDKIYATDTASDSVLIFTLS